ncbi:integrating conjugative element protein [Pseudomonas putida]|uniref:Integrating conjugative element protein n=2 Tax=Pseudomonadota TaxID=1224 RepID=A0A1L7NGN7_PSEPU|nr:integrating conjugative element protein [Pseudomonas putida]
MGALDMPTSLSRFASGWRTLGLAVALPASLAVFSPTTFAADVVVITDSRHPVKTMGGERLIELDEAPRIEAELSAALPADPEQATAVVKRRLSQGGADLQRRIATAYQGVADAWSLGITTIPAVVVDQRYVVYGEPDVARAIARIEQHRRAEP